MNRSARADRRGVRGPSAARPAAEAEARRAGRHGKQIEVYRGTKSDQVKVGG